MRLRMATDLSWRPYNATSLIYRKERLLAITPAHEGDNARFNVSDADKMKMIER